MADNNIELKSVKELLGMKFFIPSYQRGYRWTEQQVKDLLNDIWDFSKTKKQETEFYCLQPLVVKRKEEDILGRIKEAKTIEEVEALLRGSWEVIDGQQRLTTIFIILSELKGENIYYLQYETRKESDDYLQNISEDKKDNNVDFFHFYLAKHTVSSWFGNDKEKRSKFKDVLLKSVKFIWYESVDEDPIKVFTRLNIGKISLTNAELIKALFLNRSNFGEKESEQLKLRQQEIASEWDNIEYTLQNDEFWLFLHEKGYDRPTRIDFIFDLICDQNTLNLNDILYKSIGNDVYKTFRYFYEYYKQKEEIYESGQNDKQKTKIEICWNKVKDYFQTFKEWFDDLELYHYIGYLVEYKHSISALVSEWHRSTDKDSFVNYLKAVIKEEITKCPNLDFQYKEDGSDKKKCKSILLFQNIQTVVNQNKNNLNEEEYKLGIFYKYPFHLYKLENWDVEHINSNTTNDEEDANTQKEWLLNVYLSVDDKIQQKIQSYFVESDEEEKKKLFDEIRKTIPQNEEWTLEEKNRIWNYTLLDSSTNRSYGNAIFPGKRRVIIGKDKGVSIAIPKISKDGKLQLGEEQKAKSSFVPPCTKQVFMKYYSATMSDANYWTKVDAEGYLKNMEDCIKKLEE